MIHMYMFMYMYEEASITQLSSHAEMLAFVVHAFLCLSTITAFVWSLVLKFK